MSLTYALKDKLAIVTGSARGIGFAIAKLFAENGADLVMVDILDEVKEVAAQLQESNKHLNITVSGHLCDVTSQQQINNLFDAEIPQAHPKHQAATVLVNNAGIGKRIHFLDITEEEYVKRFDVHMKGPFLFSQAFAKKLVERFDQQKFSSDTESYASIVNIASMMAVRPIENLTHYASTKAGLDGLTRAISKDLGKYRIRCNAVLPFFIETPMTAYIDGDFKKFLVDKTVLGRFGKPVEVANLCLFLGTDASSYITGASFEIGGGA